MITTSPPAVDTLSSLLQQHQPSILLLATTYDMRDIAARLNIRNNMGLITDATDLSFADDGVKVIVPWGGETVVTATHPHGGTGNSPHTSKSLWLRAI